MSKLLLLTLTAAATYAALKYRDDLAELRAQLDLREIESGLDKQAIHRLIGHLAAVRYERAEALRLLKAAERRELEWQMFHFARTGDKLKNAPPAVIGSAGRTAHAQGVKKFTLDDLLRWTGPEGEDRA